jgi:hypothetical protein
LINGYVTFEELKVITGYSDSALVRLIMQGINQHQLELLGGVYNQEVAKPIREQLFNLEEVEKWLRIHIY